ncbi:general transcription factor IIF subunit 2-like [Dermatophagoides pteronyssinus]|uniref:General transcription factor IIF subunit 2 n=1 Tax=Dermatophagoides pteronyssinus TaxID=6956 RepID=A0A6P6Y929_DERPT|nr:general transcription factor IIF subunit 2-like [Dermatophagoides pteronyssinus]
MELDCQNAARGVWLVKVPKYISQRWAKQKPMTEIGRLNITRNTSGKMEVLFNLSEQVIRTDPNEDSVPSSSSSIKTSTNKSSSSTTTTTSVPTTTITTVSTSSSLSTKTDKPITTTSIPAEHKFAVSNINHQTLAIFSQDENSKLALEGQVVQKGECRPIGDAHYMNLKKETIRRASQPTKIVQKLDRAINNFKPINVHRSELNEDQRKKNEGKKMRDDKEIVQNTLFAAFEKHQYYNIKDLERLTKQPVPYLKEILKEICNYNAKNPHKNMWELKPQFRHYGKNNQ